MAWTQLTGTTASGASSATTGNITTTGADLLIAAVANANSDSTSITPTDTLNNAWLKASTHDDTGEGSRIAIYYCFNPKTGTDALSITASAVAVYFGAFSAGGAMSNPAVDQTNSNDNGGGGTISSFACGSITPTISNELVIAAVNFGNDNVFSQSVNNGSIVGFVQQVGGVTWGLMVAAYSQPSAAAVNMTFSFTSSIFAMCGTVASFTPSAINDLSLSNRVPIRRPVRAHSEVFRESFDTLPIKTVYYDEERHRLRLRQPWRPSSETLRDNIEGFPFTAVKTNSTLQFWDEEQHRQILRSQWRARPQVFMDEFLLFPQPAGWGFDEEQHKQERRVAWRVHPEPLRQGDMEGLPFTATVTPSMYYEEENHRLQRRAWRAHSEVFRNGDIEGLTHTAAEQILQLVLKAWIWLGQAASLNFTFTPAAAAVWKWLGQAPLLAFSLALSAPDIVWLWLGRAATFSYPTVIACTTAVWLWLGRAVVGGTHFARVIYGLLQQVGRLRSR